MVSVTQNVDFLKVGERRRFRLDNKAKSVIRVVLVVPDEEEFIVEPESKYCYVGYRPVLEPGAGIWYEVEATGKSTVAAVWVFEGGAGGRTHRVLLRVGDDDDIRENLALNRPPIRPSGSLFEIHKDDITIQPSSAPKPSRSRPPLPSIKTMSDRDILDSLRQRMGRVSPVQSPPRAKPQKEQQSDAMFYSKLLGTSVSEAPQKMPPPKSTLPEFPDEDDADPHISTALMAMESALPSEEEESKHFRNLWSEVANQEPESKPASQYSIDPDLSGLEDEPDMTN